MIITYHGDNYFRLQSGEVVVLVDPTNQRSFKGATLVVNTLKPAETEKPETDEPFWIENQGEYEIKDVIIRGWQTGYEDDRVKTIYRIDFDEIALVVMGFLKKEPDPKILEHLKNADVVIVPGSGKPWLLPTLASKLVRQIEPRLVIPSFSNGDIKLFLKEFSKDRCEPEEKLTFKKKDLDNKEMQIVCLKA